MDIVTVGKQSARSNSDVEELPIVDDPHELCLDVAHNEIISISEEIEEDEEKTDNIVARRIKGYIDNANFPRSVVGAMVKDLKQTTLFLNKCGVRLLNEDGVEFFVCLLDPCFHPKKPVVIKCTKISCSNATAHLDKKHEITSNKTLAAKRKVTLLQKKLSMSDPAFKRDPTRWFHVQLDAWDLKSMNIRNSHVEHYVTCKNIIVKSIGEARKYFSIYFMAIFLNLIKNAFGTSIDPAKCKNVDARAFFHKIKKIIEAVNKSEYLQSALEGACLQLFEQYLKLLNV
ncbi:hypothetical protein AXG93_4620s2030 [Marchantia polymorpha subsp. ruderalis]|uniref:Uncharacterized protein n=1 Tax=Marchantia polymorpha subsp. ruderalis TaxID=1480154 RepID=A0A176VX45_MARPO|nr:hypothetical protein AXG93_4620s2030 [Marchantia polymorpha subsp. ruderalis]